MEQWVGVPGAMPAGMASKSDSLGTAWQWPAPTFALLHRLTQRASSAFLNWTCRGGAGGRRAQM